MNDFLKIKFLPQKQGVTKYIFTVTSNQIVLYLKKKQQPIN